jgi:hypothetical protein
MECTLCIVYFVLAYIPNCGLFDFNLEVTVAGTVEIIETWKRDAGPQSFKSNQENG